MKKIYYLLTVFLFSYISQTSAAVINITAANFQFTPSVVTAQCNDTIRWTWVSGTHTTTSSTIPICAFPWNGSLSSTSTSFMIGVPCAGTYNYGCSIHVNMTGQIIVVCPSGISEPKNETTISLYPNPCMDKLTVKYENANEASVYNVVGEKMMTIQLSGNSGTVELNVAELSSGIYFVAIMKEGTIVETRKITKQ